MIEQENLEQRLNSELKDFIPFTGIFNLYKRLLSLGPDFVLNHTVKDDGYVILVMAYQAMYAVIPTLALAYSISKSMQ